MGLFLVLGVQRIPGEDPKLPSFHTLGDGGLTTLYQLYIHILIRHCLMLRKKLACKLLAILEFNGFPAWQEAFFLTPGPLGSRGPELELTLGL